MNGHVLQRHGRSLPEAVCLVIQSSAHFCSDQNAAGRPLPSSQGHFHCAQTGYEVGEWGGPEEGLYCCCPHLPSQSRGERSCVVVDGSECQWSGHEGCGVG